jgi:hypothetical protein
MLSRDDRGKENGYDSSDSDDQDLISPSKIRPTFRRDPGLAVKSMASPMGEGSKLLCNIARGHVLSESIRFRMSSLCRWIFIMHCLCLHACKLLLFVLVSC